MPDFIVMQMSKVNREKGYYEKIWWERIRYCLLVLEHPLGVPASLCTGVETDVWSVTIG